MEEQGEQECQLVLETQVAPALIRKVGERQSGRVSYGAVDAYLSRRRLMFDRGLLAAMFQEADFRGEGSLVPQHLIAAIAGRYPKRHYTAAWRDLAALLLGVPPLKLLDVDREPVSEGELAVNRKRAVFPYSAWADVEDLPPAPKPGPGRPTAPRPSPTASAPVGALAPRDPGPEWLSVLARAGAAGQAAGAAAPTGFGGGQQTWPAGAGAFGSGRSGALARTAGGAKAAGGAPVPGPEAEVNGCFGPLSSGGCGAPRGTFAAARAFGACSGRELLAASLRAEARGRGPPQAPPQQQHLQQQQLQQLQQRQPFAEWLASGPRAPAAAAGAGSKQPSPCAHSGHSTHSTHSAHAAHAPRAPPHQSALARLRAALRSPGDLRPPFLADFHPLMPGDEDRFRSLGQHLELRGPSIHRAG